MALYAYDEDRLVYAGDAEERKTYQCSECRQSVRARRGPHRVPHYYHRRRSPSCRLYSKSEDHLLAQLAIRSLLPPGEAIIEKPILSILRVADVLWETHQIAFEIQCSLLTPYEVQKRETDYQNAGYQIVWILDDRLYNKRHLRPAEALVRKSTCYYASIRKQSTPIFYDQFEIFFKHFRIKKGRRLKIDLQYPAPTPRRDWNAEDFPKQLIQKTAPLYFRGDLIHQALLAESIPALSFTMQNLCALEKFFTEHATEEIHPFKRLIRTWILEPFGLLMLNLLEWVEKKN